MKLRLGTGLALVLAGGACGGSSGGAKQAAPADDPAPPGGATGATAAVVTDAGPAPVVTGRTCPEARFVVYGGTTIEIVEIAGDCTSRVGGALETEGRVFDVAWPRPDQPLAVATGEHGADAAMFVLRFAPPATGAAAADAAPRRLEPAGAGQLEPEGHAFALVSDGRTIYVERCRAWGGEVDDASGESEEWSCEEHLYFALEDPAGARARPVRPAPREVFQPVFTGGKVPGTGVELRLARKRLACTAGGEQTTLDPWGAEYGAPITPLAIVPLSSTDYLLGIERSGSRMATTRRFEFQRMTGCEDGPDVGDVVPGPAGYWAERDPALGWRVHVGGSGEVVLDAGGRPARFAGDGLTWPQP